MARAETVTKLPLDRWAAIMGINPLHFNGVFVNAPAVCGQPWLQHSFQTADRISREDLAQAIQQAEGDIEAELGYRLLPDWERDEWTPTVRPIRADLFNLSVTDIRSFAQTVTAKWGYLVSGGIRAKTLIAAGRTVAYTDPDGDTYNELATITVTLPAGVPGCEAHVYFAGQNGADEFEIRPINVDDSTVPATITFRREQVVLLTRQDDLVIPSDDSHLRGVDGSSPDGDGNFVLTVDVYRVSNDPQTQVTFLWEPQGISCNNCDGVGCQLCAYTAQTGCLMLRADPRHSIVAYRPATWNSTTLEFDAAAFSVNRQPDIARLFYYAGWRDKNLACPTIRMDPQWERVVAYYAAALLDRPVCECNNLHAWVEHWRRDLAIAGSEDLRVSASDLDNPFGTRRGAVFAWRRILRNGNAIGRPVFV